MVIKQLVLLETPVAPITNQTSAVKKRPIEIAQTYTLRLERLGSLEYSLGLE